MTGRGPCIDAGEDAAHRKRPAPHPGPRCVTCHRVAGKARKRRRRETHVQRTYGVPPEALALLQAYQDGRCWGCRRAIGTSKALALDHDHRTGEARMLLCATCNQTVGHFRDDPAALIRLGLALAQPPSRAAWAAEVEPGWIVSDPDLSMWVASRLDKGVQSQTSISSTFEARHATDTDCTDVSQDRHGRSA